MNENKTTKKVICKSCETDVLETGFYTKGFVFYNLENEKRKKSISKLHDVDYPFVCEKCREDLELNQEDEEVLYDLIFSYKDLKDIEQPKEVNVEIA